MNEKRFRPWAAMTLTLCLLASLPAHGDSRDARERQWLRRMQTLQQQLNERNQALQQERDTLAARVKELEAAAPGLKQAARRANGKAARLAGELKAKAAANDALSARLQETEKTLTALKAQQAETDKALKQSEARNKHLTSVVTGKTRDIASCEGKNLTLYKINRQLLQKYASKGVWDALAQKEPFTGIEEVRIQNVLQEYRDKLDAERFKAAGGEK